MKIKKFCLRERNRFLKNLVCHQEAMTRRVVYYVILPLGYSIILCSEKKGKKYFIDLWVYTIQTLVVKFVRRNRNS